MCKPYLKLEFCCGEEGTVANTALVSSSGETPSILAARWPQPVPANWYLIPEPEFAENSVKNHLGNLPHYIYTALSQMQCVKWRES